MNDEQKNEQTSQETKADVAETPVVETAAPETTIDPQTEPETVSTAEATAEATEEAAPSDTEVKEIPHKDISSGMTIRLHEKINDISPKGEKRERLQVFEGMVLNVRGAGDSRTMTIRKVSGTVGVEKIFPLSSPNIAKIEVVKVAKTRRGNLSFLRNFRRKLKETWIK